MVKTEVQGRGGLMSEHTVGCVETSERNPGFPLLLADGRKLNVELGLIATG